jgi:alpha-amylase
MTANEHRGPLGALLGTALVLIAATTWAVVPVAPVPSQPVQWQLSWARGAVFYEIFVRSFADSDGDGKGDFKGLTAKLDYLNDGNPATGSDLGVDAIWLMPVFSSPSYHGYDTTDYEHVNPDYGTDEDFQRFLTAAHRRGIRVILDLVINHTGRDHPWFVDSASSPSSAKRDWYVWRPDNPGWTQPWGNGPTWHQRGGAYYYGIFWSGMPDLNFENPAVRAEVIRIARLWLDRGVDGLRLDAARHIVATGPGDAQNDTPETHAFWREFSAAIRASHPDALLVGENWSTTPIIATYYGDTSKVTLGDELPASFDFPLAGAIVEAVRSGVATPVLDALAEVKADYGNGVLDATFLTNHDMVRVATALGGNAAKQRLAAAILLTLPGTPFIYYGEELGLANGPTAEGDPAKRTPMPWTGKAGGGFSSGTPWHALAPGFETVNVEAESTQPGSLLAHYRALIQQRRCSAALRIGDLRVLLTPATVLAYERATGEERVLVMHNLDTVPVSGELAVSARAVEPGYASASGATLLAGTKLTYSLPPGCSATWRLRP